MHPIMMEQLAAERMTSRQREAQAHRLAEDIAPAAMHAGRIAIAAQALRLARRLDRSGVVVPTVLPR